MTDRSGLWRIEYRADLTRADSVVIPLAYLLEAEWAESARWLGMVFKKRLTVLERDKLDLLTWPELLAGDSLEPFMRQLFDRAWKAKSDAVALRSEQLARTYPRVSALHFAPQPFDAIGKYDPVKSFTGMYEHLMGLKKSLPPALIAPVVPLHPKKLAAPPRPEVEVINLADQAAA